MTENDNVVELGAGLDMSSDRILRRALDAGVEDVVLIGRMPDGGEFFESESDDPSLVLWMLEGAKRALFVLAETPLDEPDE